MELLHQLIVDLHPTISAIERALHIVNERHPWKWFRDQLVGYKIRSVIEYGDLKAKFTADLEADADLSWIEPYLIDNLGNGETLTTGAAFAGMFRDELAEYNNAVDLLNGWSDRKEPVHHSLLGTCAKFESMADPTTEWWTVTNEERFYAIRECLPFTCLYSGPGLTVYLDKPRED